MPVVVANSNVVRLRLYILGENKMEALKGEFYPSHNHAKFAQLTNGGTIYSFVVNVAVDDIREN